MLKRLFIASIISTLCILTLSSSVYAQTAQGNLTLRSGFESQDGLFGDLVAQTGDTTSHRFGLRLRGGLTRERFVVGYAVPEGTSVEVAPRAFWNLAKHGHTRFGLLTELGVRRISSAQDTPAGQTSLALTTRVSPTLTREISERAEWFTAVHLDTDIALSPGVELDTLAQPFELGARYWLGDQLALTLTGMVGGAFGYGGDGVKVRWGSTLNVAYLFEPRQTSERESSSASRTPQHVRPFIDAGWRGSMIGGHTSHGPEVRFGVMLWKERLKVGVATIS